MILRLSTRLTPRQLRERAVRLHLESVRLRQAGRATEAEALLDAVKRLDAEAFERWGEQDRDRRVAGILAALLEVGEGESA